MRKKIIQKGDPVLGKKCHPVTVFDRKLASLLDDMRDTLDYAGGAGLAAPQIGILRRVVVLLDAQGEVMELVNPEIIEESGVQSGVEGCLSLEGLFGFRDRPMHVTVRARNRRGEEYTVSGTEMVARCFCHELEHLDGHLFDEEVDQLYTEAEIDALREEERAEEEARQGKTPEEAGAESKEPGETPEKPQKKSRRTGKLTKKSPKGKKKA
jgi:peptide deformylase